MSCSWPTWPSRRSGRLPQTAREEAASRNFWSPKNPSVVLSLKLPSKLPGVVCSRVFSLPPCPPLPASHLPIADRITTSPFSVTAYHVTYHLPFSTHRLPAPHNFPHLPFTNSPLNPPAEARRLRRRAPGGPQGGALYMMMMIFRI
jgi:hypothetical protein